MMIPRWIRQVFHVLEIVAAWFLAATVVGSILAATHQIHGSIVYIVFAWWVGLAGATVHVLFRLVQRLRGHGPH